MNHNWMIEQIVLKAKDQLAAIQALSDKAIVNQLSFNSLLLLAANHPAFINDEELLTTLWGEALAVMGQANIVIAQKILNTPALLEKVSGIGLSQMGKEHLAIAKAIMQTPELLAKLGGWDLAEMGSGHLSIAQEIMTTPMLLAKITASDAWAANDGYELSLLGAAHLPIAKTIIETPALFKKLTHEHNLVGIGAAHLFCAETILKTPVLLAKLTGRGLAGMGRAHVSIAQTILNTPELFAKLNNQDIGFLAGNLSIAQSVLKTCKTPEHLAMMNEDALCSLAKYAHVSIAEAIVKNPTLLAKLKPCHLSEIGESHSAIAQFVLENPTLLEGMDSFGLRLLGQKHLFFAQKIMDTPKLLEKLDGRHLARLGEAHWSITQQIMKAPALFEKITAAGGYDEIVYMVSAHLFFAPQVLKNAKVCKEMQKHMVESLKKEVICYQTIQSKVQGFQPKAVSGVSWKLKAFLGAVSMVILGSLAATMGIMAAVIGAVSGVLLLGVVYQAKKWLAPSATEISDNKYKALMSKFKSLFVPQNAESLSEAQKQDQRFILALEEFHKKAPMLVTQWECKALENLVAHKDNPDARFAKEEEITRGVIHKP